MVRMRSIIRVFLLAALIMFLTGAHIFAETTVLNTVVTKETSGIYRIRQFVIGSGPSGPPKLTCEPILIWTTMIPSAFPGVYYPAAPAGAETVDLAGNGGHAKKDKTLIQLMGGGAAACSFTYSSAKPEPPYMDTKSYGANMSLTTPPVISTNPTTTTVDGVTYIESFTVSNLIGGIDTYGIINVTVIEYN